jgi:hypothetical protein
MRRLQRNSQASTDGATPKYYGYAFLHGAISPYGHRRGSRVPPCGKAVRQKRFTCGVESGAPF